MLPSIFGESLFDDWMDFPFRGFTSDVDHKLYGKHAARVMKTDLKEHDEGYELSIDLPGFKKDEIDRSGDPNYCTGLFKGNKQVTFKRVYGTYRFTDQECALLLSGAEIEIHDIQSSKGGTYSVKGKLKNYQFKGKKKFGFKAEFI